MVDEGDYFISEEYGTAYDGSAAFIVGVDQFHQRPVIGSMHPRRSLAQEAIERAERCPRPVETTYSLGSFVLMRSVQCVAFPRIVERTWLPKPDVTDIYPEVLA